MTDRGNLFSGKSRSGHINRCIGILGGSFNPAHDGHRHISVAAMRKIGLDEIWWMVSPGNPHKDHRELESYAYRVSHAEQIAAHPRIRVKTFEADHNLTFTADTIRALVTAFTNTRFVWLMGADNLISFHRWQRWQYIADHVAIAILDRPGYAHKALASPFAHTYQSFRIDRADARLLPFQRPPAWTLLRGRSLAISSTNIRELRKNGT